MSLEDLPVGSVVYVSRGSFRMEAVGPDGAIMGRDGVVQPMTGIVTAPYDGRPTSQNQGENTGVDRLPVSATFRAPDPRSLFGSQVDVPMLPAPTGTVQLVVPKGPMVVALPSAVLAALGGALFACGLVMGASAMRPEAPLATPDVVSLPAPAAEPVVVAATTPVEPAPMQEAPPEAEEIALPVIEVPTPVKITARTRAAARHVAAPAPPLAEPVPSKPWVDPFAD